MVFLLCFLSFSLYPETLLPPHYGSTLLNSAPDPPVLPSSYMSCLCPPSILHVEVQSALTDIQPWV